MFLHKHPYAPFIPNLSEKLIVGTLPPPRFYMGKLKKGDVNFCYGSIDGLLWKLLDELFNLQLKYENTQEAIQQRKEFLKSRKIGICDIVNSCEREKIDASDLGMKNITLRPLLKYLNENPKVHTLLLTGGNSKNGPEYFLRRLLKSEKIKLNLISNDTPKIHEFQLKNRTIKVVSLTAPSGSANRAIGSNPYYKQRKKTNQNYNTFQFRLEQYKPYF